MAKNSPEDTLRKKICKALRNNPNVSNVQETHGTHEYGIDITFEVNDGFDSPLHCGIQVKSGNITASVVQITLGQLSVAFGHDFTISKNGLDLAYVITDGEIIQPATEQINSANVGFRNVKWIDGEGLNVFLKSYEGKMNFTKEE